MQHKMRNRTCHRANNRALMVAILTWLAAAASTAHQFPTIGRDHISNSRGRDGGVDGAGADGARDGDILSLTYPDMDTMTKPLYEGLGTLLEDVDFDDDDDDVVDECIDDNNGQPCHDCYEAPEPFEYLHDYCANCNPAVPESPDPLVAMTWGGLNNPSAGIGGSDNDNDNANDNDFDVNNDQEGSRHERPQQRQQRNDSGGEVLQKLQIYRVYQPVSYKIILPKAEGDDRDSTAANGRRRQLMSVVGAEEFFSSRSDPRQRRRQRRFRLSNRRGNDFPCNNDNRGGTLRIYQNCTIVLDWGVERAAWMELLLGPQSADIEYTIPIESSSRMALDGTTTTTTTTTTVGTKQNKIQILASISEFNEPFPDKTMPLTKYGNYTYRLETNPELYEGVRFSFLQFIFPEIDQSNDDRNNDQNDSVSFVEITGISLVAKVKPVAYMGSFSSSDVILTQAWYTGAYGVRLNMEENDLNSVLMERGDRVAIQGDGHPTIDAALVAFSPFDLIRNVLNQTDSSHKRVVDDVIMAYPLYWCLSAIDYYLASGDTAWFVEQLAPDIMVLLDKRINDFLDPYLDITWFGWDDRLGNGWCFHSKNNDTCTSEALWSFATLVIRVCKDLIRAMKSANMSPLAIQKYERAVTAMTDAVRNLDAYPDGFGVHAAANAINAGIATPDETDRWLQTTLNDAVTVCSFSQFNQYWILQAFGNVGTAAGMERALASIKLCWGPMLTLGKGCFWEVSSPEWLRFMKDGERAPHLPSYCHPWASGVTPWLSHMLGGVQPLTPGYSEFVAMPYLSWRYPSVNSTIGTPHGPIIVKASLRQRSVSSAEEESLTEQWTDTRVPNNQVFFEAHVDCSISVVGVFGIRLELLGGAIGDNEGEPIPAHLDFDSIRVNGEKAVVATFDNIVASLGDIAESRRRQHFLIRLDGLRGYRITASYSHDDSNSKDSSSTLRRRLPASTIQKTPLENLSKQPVWDASPFPKPNYPVTIDPIDRQSQGDGLLRYGDDGYVLLGCNEGGQDLVNLPPYISNVTVRRHGYPGWVVPEREFVGYSDSNPIYLPVDEMLRRHTLREVDTGNPRRALGMVGPNDSAGGGDFSCVFIDVVSNEGCDQHYSLSLYFVGLTDENRHAIRVMDGTTFNVIAPTTLVTDYAEGVWWTLHYNCSVRVKLMDVNGIHVSAVAFASRGIQETVESMAAETV